MPKDIFLKFVSLNIEFNRHLNVVLPFLKQQAPDVLFLQEVLERDLPTIKKTTSMDYVFTPLAKFKIDGEILILGLAIFSKFIIDEKKIMYYRGSREKLPTLSLSAPGRMSRAIMGIKLNFNSKVYYLVNTHFTWTPNGTANNKQHGDLKKMMAILKQDKELVLTGDFNAPRGEAIFDELARIYKDNIPTNVTTTIDPNLHRIKNLKLVVDGIFTTPAYSVKDVEVISDLSDHCALVAKISKI